MLLVHAQPINYQSFQKHCGCSSDWQRVLHWPARRLLLRLLHPNSGRYTGVHLASLQLWLSVFVVKNNWGGLQSLWEWIVLGTIPWVRCVGYCKRGDLLDSKWAISWRMLGWPRATLMLRINMVRKWKRANIRVYFSPVSNTDLCIPWHDRVGLNFHARVYLECAYSMRNVVANLRQCLCTLENKLTEWCFIFSKLWIENIGLQITSVLQSDFFCNDYNTTRQSTLRQPMAVGRRPKLCVLTEYEWDRDTENSPMNGKSMGYLRIDCICFIPYR